MTEASAPGKIVVSGEYAVLGDAPALAMAVDRRVRVSAVPGGTPDWSLETPGYLDGAWTFSLRERRIEWHDPAPAGAAMRLIERVVLRVGRPERACAIRVDSTDFHAAAGGAKLGLGSSAAVAVALTAALAGPLTERDLMESANRAHAEFQGGLGSGIDIATSIAGGLVHYRRNAAPRRLDWPRDLGYAVLWSGRPASTTDRIGGLDYGSAGLRALGGVAAGVASAWQTGDARDALASLGGYADALCAFDKRERLGIFASGHEQLFHMATSYQDLVYKPCGAGGGDIGIAVATSSAVLERFVRQSREAGFIPLDVGLDTAGVTVY